MTSLKPLWDGFSYKTHQIDGVEWMLKREDSDFPGGLLCDEMGLGKTMEVLGLAKNSKKHNTLILCPKAVIMQWCVAAEKSSFNVFRLEPQGWQMTGAYHSGQPFIFVTNYEKLQKKTFFERSWDRVVLDEAHRAKRKRGLIWTSVKAMERKATWCVTATPVVNDLVDIRNLFQLIGYDPIELTNHAYLLEKVVPEACLHRSMEEMRPIITELPAAPLIQKERLEFATSEEADFYRGIQGKILRRWKALESDITPFKLSLINRLRQISLHPQVYINARRKASVFYDRKDWEGSSTKFSALRAKLEDPHVAPARWIVFCQFHDEIDILSAYLEKSKNIDLVQHYDGRLTDTEKEEVLETTKTPLTDKHQVLLLQLQSGGVGLNLQHFTKIVFLSPWWTAALMDQAVGRAVRIGQAEVVEVTMLVLKEEEVEDRINIDKLMLDKVDMKRGVLQKLFTGAARGIDKVGAPTSDPASAEEAEEEEEEEEEGDAEEEEEEGEDPV
jgi:SNF2 family DNA or RNA helicase